MRSAAVSAATSRSLRLLLLLAVALSLAVVKAFSNFHSRHSRKFGSVKSRGIFSDPAYQCHRPGQRRECARAPILALKSTISDDHPNSTSTPTTHLSDGDIQHMTLATSLARIGYGNTFPNPAVGCVLVRHEAGSVPPDVVVGSGFHPKSGMPHAEVFALLEACGHLADGVASARSVMAAPRGDGDAGDEEGLRRELLELLEVYKSEDGASKLFAGRFDAANVTAYVTLEPCCHFGQTPPCALSLVAAGVDRVVVGYRDPNPRVDGGGIRVLKNVGIGVRVLSALEAQDEPEGASSDEREAATECAALVEYFVKRISPREAPAGDPNEAITGKKRRALRSIAGRQKSAGAIQQIGWPKDDATTEEDDTSGAVAEQIPLGHRFLERVDRSLWDHEIVLLRLNNAVQKKKGAKVLGGRIAETLNAHVAQVIGHTALLYRPAFPPILDLDEIAENGVVGESSSN